MNTKSHKEPVLFIYSRSNGIQWTFEDVIGRVRSGFDPILKGESNTANESIRRTVLNVERAIGYKLREKLDVRFDTDFSDGSENIEQARNAYFP